MFQVNGSGSLIEGAKHAKLLAHGMAQGQDIPGKQMIAEGGGGGAVRKLRRRDCDDGSAR